MFRSESKQSQCRLTLPLEQVLGWSVSLYDCFVMIDTHKARRAVVLVLACCAAAKAAAQTGTEDSGFAGQYRAGKAAMTAAGATRRVAHLSAWKRWIRVSRRSTPLWHSLLKARIFSSRHRGGTGSAQIETGIARFGCAIGAVARRVWQEPGGLARTGEGISFCR